MDTLKGKSILFLCPNFYAYRGLLTKQMESEGAKVYFFENKMFVEDWRCSTFKPLALYRYLLNPHYKDKYVKQVLDETKSISFDIFFAINGFCVTKELIKTLKERNPKLVSILFLWDSLVYWRYSNIIKWFDYKYSFDHADCEKYKNEGLTYCPDFYIGNNSSRNVTYDYDVVHIGSLSVFSVDRIKLLSELQQECERKELRSYIKIVTRYPDDVRRKKWRYAALFLLDSKYRKLFYSLYKYRKSPILTTQRLALSKVHEIESSSKVIVDIPPTKQKGATIRSLEALNRGQKLLTTNRSMALDSFYSPNNIAFMDMNVKEKIHADFLSTECDAIDISNLQVKNWIKSLLCRD